MMSTAPRDFKIQPSVTPEKYELRLNGRLSQPTEPWFEDMNVTVDETTSPAQTVISGFMRDQAALYGLINRIRDLGLTLLSVNKLDIEDNP